MFLVCLVTIPVTNARASAIGFHGLGLRLSYANPEDMDPTAGFGLHLELGEIYRKIFLTPGVEYWNSGFQEAGVGKVDASAWQFNADGKYCFPTQSNLRLFAGTGIAVILNKGRVELDGLPGFLNEGSNTGTNTELGVNIFGGGGKRFWHFLEAGGMIAYTISKTSVLRISVGFTWWFRK